MEIVQHTIEKLADKGQQEACTTELTRVVVAGSDSVQLMTVQRATLAVMASSDMCVKMLRIIHIDVKNDVKSMGDRSPEREFMTLLRLN
jgi:predicted RNA-binding protein with PIN domain